MAKPKFPKKTNGNAGVTAAESASTGLPAMAAPTSELVRKEAKKSMPKPTIVRSDGRPNIVPINVEEEIRSLAYLLSERRGFEPGHESEDWLAAEHEVRQRYHQQSA
ncbi:MAG: DUF2934 domain-containing protein [Candidatus Sulfotelmatobacter sp.]